MDLARLSPLAALGALALFSLAGGRSPARALGIGSKAAPRHATAIGENAAARATEDALTRGFPAGAALVLEAPALGALLHSSSDHPLLRRLKASPLGPQLESALAEWTARVADTSGFDVRAALAEISSRGAALAVTQREGRPAWVVAARGGAEAGVRAALESALAAVAAKAGFPGALRAPSEHSGGVDWWFLGEDLALAQAGDRLWASNDRAALRALFESSASATKSRAESTDGSLVLTGSFDAESARGWRASSRDATPWERLGDVASQPAAQFLLGPGLSTLGRARRIAFSLRATADGLALDARAEGVEAGAAGVLLPIASHAAAPGVVARADDVANALVYRDVAKLFRERTRLFDAQFGPKFAEAESNLALFFGGADVGETVLPALSPWLRLVARPVTFRSQARPEVPLPAAALIARVDRADEIGPQLVSAFQTLVGILNVERAQKGLDALQLELRQAGDATVTSARFRAPRAGEGVDLRYNLEPACALVGDAWIVGTHAELVAALANELQDADGPAARPAVEHLTLSGPALADVLARNRELLAMRAVLEEGKSPERAEQDLDLFGRIAATVERLEVHVACRDEHTIDVGLTVALVAPAHGGTK